MNENIEHLWFSEGRVYGARYYTVEPNFGTATTWHELEWDRLIEWCVSTYGPTPMKGIFEPGGRWYANNAKIWFRDIADRDLFVLKWL